MINYILTGTEEQIRNLAICLDNEYDYGDYTEITDIYWTRIGVHDKVDMKLEFLNQAEVNRFKKKYGVCSVAPVRGVPGFMKFGKRYYAQE